MPPISHLKFIRAQFLPVEKIVKRFFIFFDDIIDKYRILLHSKIIITVKLS